MKENNKSNYAYWGLYIKTMCISFLIFIISIFIIVEKDIESNSIFYLCLAFFFIAAISEIIFNLGMVYNAFKQKKYIWMICIFFFGIIFSILFYFKHIDRKVENS